MKIRPAVLADLDQLEELGKRMHAESPRFSRLTYNAGKVYSMLTTALHDPRYFLHVAEQDNGELAGGFAGIAMPHWCSDDEVACDLALFVEPGRRGGMAAVRLIKAFVAWAENRSAKQINLGISTGVHTEETAQLYRAIGLKQFGYLFEV